MGFLNKLFGTNMAKELKRVEPLVKKVEALEEEYKNLTDAQLQAKTPEFQERYRQGETLDDLLPEAFAACREAADRVLGLRPYRVQIIGGIILHQGRIAEMKTGEGKTLVAVLPAYLNALTGEGVHIVTVNDYLARRDSEWMGKVHRFLGLSVGLIVHGLDADEVREVLSSERYHDDVVMDEREAAYHGVHAVPFFVINGKYSISGAPDTEGLRQALLKLMAKEAEEQMASGMSCGPEGCKLR